MRTPTRTTRDAVGRTAALAEGELVHVVRSAALNPILTPNAIRSASLCTPTETPLLGVQPMSYVNPETAAVTQAIQGLLQVLPRLAQQSTARS